jgi:hypothetical protein
MIRRPSMAVGCWRWSACPPERGYAEITGAGWCGPMSPGVRQEARSPPLSKLVMRRRSVRARRSWQFVSAGASLVRPFYVAVVGADRWRASDRWFTGGAGRPDWPGPWIGWRRGLPRAGRSSRVTRRRAGGGQVHPSCGSPRTVILGPVAAGGGAGWAGTPVRACRREQAGQRCVQVRSFLRHRPEVACPSLAAGFTGCHWPTSVTVASISRRLWAANRPGRRHSGYSSFRQLRGSAGCAFGVRSSRKLK